MKGRQVNDYPICFAKQLAIPGMRLTVGLGLGELSPSDQIPPRHDAARRHDPTSTVAAGKGIHAI